MSPLPPGAQWFEQQLCSAAAAGTSDLTIEPRDDGGHDALLRRDGLRSTVASCPAADSPAAIARAKALAQLPAYVVDEVQDGSFDGIPYGISGHIRLAVLPTVRGQRLALRLPAIGPLPDCADLGLPDMVLQEVRACVRQPDGLLLFAGPTGSGKTTTMHSLLREMVGSGHERSAIAIEDPVERRLDGVSHVAVDEARGLDFLAAVRAVLRQDADIIMVGEVRDGATAQACVRAALAGHLVLASVHAPRAREVVPRLFEMGLEANILLPVLRGVLAQRLLRRRNADGYGGRCLVADWLKVDDEMRSAWRQGTHQQIPLGADMDQWAAELVARGTTDEGERLRVLGR